jgi:2-polyprenyl-6-hydroxyphenyl methylase/3-demethylubiquinone-9 3-methyltransferase
VSNDLAQYNQMAAIWWDPNGPFALLHELVPVRLRFFDQFVPHWTQLTALDVGCGGGFMAEALSQRGAQVVGIDIAEDLLAVATTHGQSKQLNIHYQVGSAYSLPFKDESFDHVVCVDVIEHLENKKRAIQEIYRVLKPGGYFLFDTISKSFLSKWVSVFLMEKILKQIPKNTHDWSLFITPENLGRLLKECGFNELNFSGTKPVSFFPRIKLGLGKSTQMLYLGSARKISYEE